MHNNINSPPPGGDDILHGNLSRAIWKMLWPILAYSSTVALSTMADTWVAGQMGSQAQAAVGTGELLWFFMILIAVGLATGTTTLVSRFWGGADSKNAVLAARHALVLSVLVGAAATLSALTICRPILHYMGLSPEVSDLSWSYLQFNLVSLLPFTMTNVLNAIFRALGQSRIQMQSMILMSSLVLFFDYTLCIHPFHMGVQGIGLSWGIAGTAGLLLCLWRLKSSPLKISLSLSDFNPANMSPIWWWRLLKIGLPTCVRDLINVTASFLMLYIFTRCANPVAAMASWAVGAKLGDMIVVTLNSSLAGAVGPIAGQNIGAGNVARAEATGWTASKIGLLLAGGLSLICFVFAPQIASFMSHDPLVVEYTVSYLRIISVVQPLAAVWYCLDGVMEGVGYVALPAVLSTSIIIVLRLPLAWLLAITLLMGPSGAWLGIALTEALICLGMYLLYRAGYWKKHKV